MDAASLRNMSPLTEHGTPQNGAPGTPTFAHSTQQSVYPSTVERGASVNMLLQQVQRLQEEASAVRSERDAAAASSAALAVDVERYSSDASAAAAAAASARTDATNTTALSAQREQSLVAQLDAVRDTTTECRLAAERETARADAAERRADALELQLERRQQRISQLEASLAASKAELSARPQAQVDVEGIVAARLAVAEDHSKQAAAAYDARAAELQARLVELKGAVARAEEAAARQQTLREGVEADRQALYDKLSDVRVEAARLEERHAASQAEGAAVKLALQGVERRAEEASNRARALGEQATELRHQLERAKHQAGDAERGHEAALKRLRDERARDGAVSEKAQDGAQAVLEEATAKVAALTKEIAAKDETLAAIEARLGGILVGGGGGRRRRRPAKAAAAAYPPAAALEYAEPLRRSTLEDALDASHEAMLDATRETAFGSRRRVDADYDPYGAMQLSCDGMKEMASEGAYDHDFSEHRDDHGAWLGLGSSKTRHGPAEGGISWEVAWGDVSPPLERVL